MKFVEWGLVVFVILVLVGILLPPSSNDVVPAERTENRSTVFGVVTAVKAFQTDYGYPIGLRADGRYETAEDNARLFDVLLAKNRAENPKGVTYYENKNAKRGHLGFTPQGVLVDRWGHPYRIRIGVNANEGVTNPYTADAKFVPVIHSDVIVWSLGKDGVLGKDGAGQQLAGSDDMVSWQ